MSNWDTVCLGDVTEVITKGTTPTTLGFSFQDEGINFVKIESITENGLFLQDKFEHISDQCNDKLKRSQLKENDILFSIAGAIGRTALVTSDILPANTNQALAIIRLNNPELLHDYVIYSLKSDSIFKQFEKQKQGVAQLNISLKNVSDLVIPLPPLEEQRKIAANLDKATHLIDLCNAILGKLDLLVKARFEELSAQWIGDVSPEPLCNYLESITYGFTNPMPDSDDGPWKITAKDVVNGQVNLSTARKTTQEAYNDLTEKSKPLKGDVLLTKDGTLGRVAIVNENNICVNQSVAVLRPNKRIISIFLSQLLQMPIYQREMLKNAGGGTIKHIYITKVDKMRILVPPINQQQQFAAFVAQTDKTKAAVQQVLSKAETLKKALMQEYFG